MNLRSVDLNLLVVFDALLRERSVTQAAVRLHLTQPAVSHALARLRGLFGDPLFVRTPAGLECTETAARLAAPVAAALNEIARILEPAAAFFPARATGPLTVGMSDYAAFVLLPKLAARIRAAAPGIRLMVRHTSHVQGFATLDDEEAGVIVGNFPTPPARFEAQLLFREGFVCAARRDHPGFAKRLTLGAYVSFDHLHVSLHGEPAGPVDALLRRKRRRRSVVLTVGHFLVAAPVLAETDLVATEPARVIAPAAVRFGLACQPPPFKIPEFEVVQIWPRRLSNDGASCWLREQIATVATDLRGGP